MARVGVFDPEIRQETIFDEEIVQEGWLDKDAIQILDVAATLYTDPRTPFKVFAMYNFATEEITIEALLAAFPHKVHADVDAPVGITNLNGVIGQVPKPRVVFVFSMNDKPFDIDPGGGFCGMFATVYFVALQQIGAAGLRVNCPEPSDLRIIVAGDP